MGHRFSKFKSDLRRKEAFSFSDSTYSFPDLLRMCRFDQESFGSGLEGLPNVCFGLVNSHDDNPWFGTSPRHWFENNLPPIFLGHLKIEKRDMRRERGT